MSNGARSTAGSGQGEVPLVTASPTPAAGLEQQTVDLINQRRQALGLQALWVDSHLTAAARRHSYDIGPAGLCQHEGTDGSSPWDRIDQSGYTGFGNAEVVGCGYNSPQGVVDAWWNSPAHHDILVALDTNDIGCGWWLDAQGYGWQTCDTGISDRPVSSPTATSTRTASPTRTATASRTPTRPSATPTSTPTPGLAGHVTWQGRPAQPSSVQQAPITLTLRLGSTVVNYPVRNTDASGFFTVSVAGLANGTYSWRAKGPQFLATSGSVALSGARVTNTEMGTQRVGDTNNDNTVNSVDLTLLKATLGRMPGDPGYDGRADFNGDSIVTMMDFTLLRANFGSSGAP
ncbi:MAG: CAP domain-containing protein [Chloroflexia bacterium]